MLKTCTKNTSNSAKQTEIFGSGSIRGESQCTIVLVQKQAQAEVVHRLTLGKRERLPDEASESLPQGIIPPLDVRCLTRVFAARRMLLIWNHLLIGLPEVTVAVRGAVRFRNLLPQLLTSGAAAVADNIGYDLASGTTERNPNPAFACLFQHK